MKFWVPFFAILLLKFSRYIYYNNRAQSSFFVHSNEFVLEIPSPYDAMFSLCWLWLYSFCYNPWCPTLLLASLPGFLTNSTTRVRSRTQAKDISALFASIVDPIYRHGPWHPQQGFLNGWCKLSKRTQQVHHKPKSALSSLKKISMLDLASCGILYWQGPQLCRWKKDD